MTNQDQDEIRRLRWLLKRANATMGQQGQTIHLLRAESAEVRELNSKIDRGELRRLQRKEGEYQETIDNLREENHKLATRLSEEQAKNKESQDA